LAQHFAETMQFPFPFGPDKTGAICRPYGVESTPTSIFISRRGRTLKVHVGAYANPEDFKQDLTALLAS
jgi:hypothetical protein